MREMPKCRYKTIGKFQIKRIIRSTGSSDLYEGFDPDLQARVALKVFDPKERLLKALPYSVENWKTRFIREARVLAAIDHPNVVSVRTLSYIEDKPYYVMPFVATNLLYEIGRDYEAEEGDYAPEILDSPDPKAISVKRSVDVLFQTALALSAFHGRGIIHRDIKPGNVLLTRLETGAVKLCDPGLMKYPSSEESTPGYWVGTRDYIAPEQMRSSESVDARADVYSLGVLGYRMMTGFLPRGVLSGPGEDCEGVPDALNDLIMRAISRKLKRRPENALAFLQELGPIRFQLQRT